ncbi:hypothetical protein ABPG74_021508 [Tetrahymena malaccensis]
MQLVKVYIFLVILVKCAQTFQLVQFQREDIDPDSCDQNISAQLTNQNVTFDCLDGILKLQKQPFITIQNVIELKISNLNIEQQIYLEQSQSTQMILCENINSLTINNMTLKNNSFNYLLQEQNSEIQLQSQQIQIDSLFIDSYDGAVQIISDQQLIIQEIISINSLQKDQNFTFLVECNNCTIGNILVYKENQFVIDIISTLFNFQVQQQLTIQNMTLITDQNCHLCNYQWQFNNQTSQGTQIQSEQFIQINYINILQTFQSQKLDSLSSIFIYASDINSFTIQNALFQNVSSSDLAISFNNIHSAQFSNIKALNCTQIVDFFTIIRSNQVNFQNIFIDFITANSTNQLITLSTFTLAYFDNLMLPIDPHLENEIQKFRSGNPLITVVDGEFVQFNSSQINLKNVESAFIVFIDINQFISINTTFLNIYSYKNSNGGCLNFGNTNSITLSLTDTIFDTCISSQFGGAIFGGILKKAKNVLVTNCRSEVGGGFFLSNKSDLLELKNVVFVFNKATFYSDDYLLGFKSITIDSIYEYNQNLGGTDLYFKQINQQSNNTYTMYSGLIYAIYFKIQMNDKDEQQLDLPVNLYMFCQLNSNLQQNFQQFYIPIMNNLPYMILYQNPANFLTDQKIVLKFADSFTIDQTFTIPNGFCAEEGYIGPQCLSCDRNGVFWNQSFGQSGTFQCNLCGNKKDNTIKIILAFLCFYFIIIILIYSNFKSLMNMLYTSYLSKMSIIFIGNSVQKQGETSVLIKTLMFNFSIYQVSNFISQKNLLDYLSFFSSNPIDAQFISIDCFLNNILPSDFNIGIRDINYHSSNNQYSRFFTTKTIKALQQWRIKRLQKYRTFSCLSYYFPIYPYRLFQNFKKLREKVISKSYKMALQSEFLPLKSNVQMQDLSLEKYVQSETLLFKSE